MDYYCQAQHRPIPQAFTNQRRQGHKNARYQTQHLQTQTSHAGGVSGQLRLCNNSSSLMKLSVSVWIDGNPRATYIYTRLDGGVARQTSIFMTGSRQSEIEELLDDYVAYVSGTEWRGGPVYTGGRLWVSLNIGCMFQATDKLPWSTYVA